MYDDELTAFEDDRQEGKKNARVTATMAEGSLMRRTGGGRLPW